MTSNIATSVENYSAARLGRNGRPQKGGLAGRKDVRGTAPHGRCPARALGTERQPTVRRLAITSAPAARSAPPRVATAPAVEAAVTLAMAR